MRALGIAFIPYFPLMSGLLSGKYHRGEPPSAGTRIAGTAPERQQELLSPTAGSTSSRRWNAYATDHGHTILELAIAWLAAKPAVASVIAGATKPEQIWANVKGARLGLSATKRCKKSTPSSLPQSPPPDFPAAVGTLRTIERRKRHHRNPFRSNRAENFSPGSGRAASASGPRGGG